MKERAKKSFGGSCMSKFVEESERKRIERLHTVKSSFPTHADPSSRTRKNVAKSQKVIRRGTYNDAGSGELQRDFRLRNLCEGTASEFTRSGLRLTVSDCEASLLRTETNTKTDTRGKVMAKNKVSEGKENFSPSHVASAKVGIDRFRSDTTTRSAHHCEGKKDGTLRTEHKKSEPSIAKHTLEKKNEKHRTTCSVTVGPKDSGEKLVHRPGRYLSTNRDAERKSKNIASKVVANTKPSNPSKQLPGGVNKLKSDGNKNKKIYGRVSRGVSIESLSKEHEEALTILKEIDKSNLIGKMTQMQMSMDIMNEHNRGTTMNAKVLLEANDCQISANINEVENGVSRSSWDDVTTHSYSECDDDSRPEIDDAYSESFVSDNSNEQLDDYGEEESKENDGVQPDDNYQSHSSSSATSRLHWNQNEDQLSDLSGEDHREDDENLGSSFKVESFFLAVG